MARTWLYRFLAQAYQDPTADTWAQLTHPTAHSTLELTVNTLAVPESPLPATAAALRSQLQPESFESFLAAYLAVFGHAARGRCPLNEIEYGDIKADPLFQPHRLADLAAFYRAFGLELADDADERHDHLCLELEFMCVLVAKEAYALEHQLDAESLSVCRDAQKRFLREHLGRWTPAFCRRLARMAGESPLAALANFTREFVETECARFSVPAGSEDLLLRPVDLNQERLCSSCGANHAPEVGRAQP
jgi:DMSO reductase family type II enzyme chaperone